jgi:isopenicillin-N N-acyltransferase-like protein
MAAFDVLDLSGGPRERGRAHGEALTDAVAANVETYLSRFAHEGVDPDRAREQADEFVPLIGSVNPEYAAEMRGVAEGSGVPLTDVALLNVRYEVIYTAWKERAERRAAGGADSESGGDPEGERGDDGRDPRAAGVDGCTSFGLLPAATADGKTYVGQNWDWLAPIRDTVVLARVRRPDAPDHVVFTEAGIVGGKAGVNEHGVGLGLNGLTSPADGEEPFRKPIHVRCREVMDARGLADAMAPIVETHRPASANFMLGAAGGGAGGGDGRGGEVIDVEAAPERFGHLHPTDGVLTHANHFVDDRIESLSERRGASTLYRAERLRRHLAAERDAGGVTVEGITAGLRDHFGRPASVCSHVDGRLPEAEHGRTNASFVIDLDDRRLHAVRGPPCEGEYRTHGLAG